MYANLYVQWKINELWFPPILSHTHTPSRAPYISSCKIGNANSLLYSLLFGKQPWKYVSPDDLATFQTEHIPYLNFGLCARVRVRLYAYNHVYVYIVLFVVQRGPSRLRWIERKIELRTREQYGKLIIGEKSTISQRWDVLKWKWPNAWWRCWARFYETLVLSISLYLFVLTARSINENRVTRGTI